jgi:MFS family permease
LLKLSPQYEAGLSTDRGGDSSATAATTAATRVEHGPPMRDAPAAMSGCFSERAQVGISLVCMFSDYFGIGIIAPLLPFWLRDRDYSLRWVGIITFAQYVAVIVGLPLFGAVSKRLGVEATMLFLMIADSALFGGSGLCESAAALCAVRVGAGFCAPQGLAISWIASLGEPERLPRRMGLVAAFIHVGVLAGALVGGALGWRRWREACAVSAAPTVLCAAWLAVAVARPGRLERRTGAAGAAAAAAAAAEPVSRPALAAVATIMFCNGFVVTAGLAAWAVVYVDEYGFTSKQVALSLVPAATAQIFLHALLLPRLLASCNAWRASAALAACVAAVFVGCAAAVAFADPGPWPLLAAATASYWLCSLNQGTANFLSASLTAGSPDAAALVGGVRSAFNTGCAAGPLALIAAYFDRGLGAALLVCAGLFVVAAAAAAAGARAAPDPLARRRNKVPLDEPADPL